MKRFMLALSILGIACIVPRAALTQDQGSKPQEFNLTLTGDSIIMTPATVHQNEPQFAGLLKVVRQGDAAFTNLEEIYPGPTAYSGPGSAMWTDPAMLKELQWMGFNLFSAANNHTMDFGVQGMLDTMHALQQDGAVYSGIGNTLGEARKPGYLMTAHGRVALIHCTSSLPAYYAALDPRGDMSGRPGPNILRYQTIYQADAATFDVLRKYRQALNPEPDLYGGQPGADATKTMNFPGNANGLSGFFPPVFQLSDKAGVITKANPEDLAGIVHSIKSARSFANYVVVSIHAHEGAPAPDSESLPAQFLVEFAHAAIDAGADVFVGHGPHVLKGIEIYKGKVIIYSIGNLWFQHQLQGIPLAYYQRFHLGADSLPADVIAAEDAVNPQTNPLYYQSVVARVVFHDGRPDQVILTPIALTTKMPRPNGGIPGLADPKLGAQILDRLQKLSQAYGTKMTIENGVGIIKISDSGK